MNTKHTTLPLSGLTLHLIDFTPDSFTDSDLLWLPHHAKLTNAGRKRKAEHLAGRLAAFHALRERGIAHIPDIGENRQPVWPAGWRGSISHSGTTAIAVIDREAVGIDLEEIFSEPVCEEIATSVVNELENQRLQACVHAFPLALTLAFSAKESLYKAFSGFTTALPGFQSAEVTAIDACQLTLQINETFSPALAGRQYQVAWQQQGNHIITLLAETWQPA